MDEDRAKAAEDYQRTRHQYMERYWDDAPRDDVTEYWALNRLKDEITMGIVNPDVPRFRRTR